MMTDFYLQPPDYQRLTQKLEQLKKEYPFIKLFPIGKSVLGRKLYAIGIGNLKYANLFAASFHAQEWLTCSLMVRFAEDVCASMAQKTHMGDISFQEAFMEKGLILVPMVNPDGVEIALHGAQSAKHLQKFVRQVAAKSTQSWQANAHGVDLNHNYDAQFDLCKKAEEASGIVSPMPRQYGGKSPHSEPETKAVANLCCSFNVRCAFAFHSQGEEIMFEYGEHTPQASKYIASLLASCSGYQVIRPTGLASHGGFKDWFIDKLHRPGFTVEIGRGVNPLPITDLEPIYIKLKEMLVVAALV